MQGVADGGGEMRSRGTRDPTDAAVAGRPPYQAVQGQAVQLLRFSGEGRAPHEHGSAAREGTCTHVFGAVKRLWGMLPMRPLIFGNRVL